MLRKLAPEIDPAATRTMDPLAPHSLAPSELQKVLRAERGDVPFLVLRHADGKLVVVRLSASATPMTVGRDPGLDLSLPWDTELSALHAELELVGGQWILVDDGLSRNGTYVNGERLGGRKRLRDGDRLRMGQTTIVFRSAGVAATTETRAASDSASLPQLSDTQRRILIALCRPMRDGSRFAAPAPNKQIADEVYLSVHGVKMQLRKLFGLFEIGPLPQNKKRFRLAELALQLGVVSERDFS